MIFGCTTFYSDLRNVRGANLFDALEAGQHGKPCVGRPIKDALPRHVKSALVGRGGLAPFFPGRLTRPRNEATLVACPAAS